MVVSCVAFVGCVTVFVLINLIWICLRLFYFIVSTCDTFVVLFYCLTLSLFWLIVGFVLIFYCALIVFVWLCFVSVVWLL